MYNYHPEFRFLDSFIKIRLAMAINKKCDFPECKPCHYYVLKDVGLYTYKDKKLERTLYDLEAISEEIEECLRDATGLRIDVLITDNSDIHYESLNE